MKRLRILRAGEADGGGIGTSPPPDLGSQGALTRFRAASPIEQILLFLRVVGYDKPGEFVAIDPDHIAYNFAISLKRGGDRQALREGGDCVGHKTAECVVGCDKGGVTIENSSNDPGLLLRLTDRGIGFGGQCDLKPGLSVKPGADDETFLLEPAPLELCQPLAKELFEPRATGPYSASHRLFILPCDAAAG